MMTDKNALLVNYEFCSGCRSCEIACRNEHGLGLGEWGVKVAEVKPFELKDEQAVAKKFEWIFQPVPTKLCDMCADRQARGEKPACVHHCLAFCLEYGTPDEMLARAKELGSRVSIFLP